jgi:hypothetical protein
MHLRGLRLAAPTRRRALPVAQSADPPIDDAGGHTSLRLGAPTSVAAAVAVVTRSLTRPEIASLAADLRAMLHRIESGELDATPPMRNRIEGAVAALEAVLGNRASLGFDLNAERPVSG